MRPAPGGSADGTEAVAQGPEGATEKNGAEVQESGRAETMERERSLGAGGALPGQMSELVEGGGLGIAGIRIGLELGEGGHTIGFHGKGQDVPSNAKQEPFLRWKPGCVRGEGRGRGGNGMKTLLKRLLTGWILAFALMGGYWGMALMPVNRWGMYFTRLDFWAILFLTVAEGTVLGLGAFLLERLVPRSRPFLAASFWGWVAIAFANNYPELHKTISHMMGWRWLTGPVWWGTIWIAGGAGIACALLLPAWRRATAECWRFTRRFLWLLFAVPFLVWRLPTHEAASGNGLDFGRVPGNGKAATVILLFDMLGYEELFDETGEVRPAYTNFAAFCRQADVFHAATSAGVNTAASLPGFIVQKRLSGNGWEVRMGFDDWAFPDGTNTVRMRDFAGQSLPEEARRAGGRAQAIGTYIPWDSLLPGAWNATESMGDRYGNHGVHVFGRKPGFLTAVKEHFVWYFSWVSKSPMAALLKASGLTVFADAQGYDDRVSLVARAGKLLREALSPGDFVFVHVDMPHDPYLVGRGGKPLPPSLHWDDRAGLAAQTEGADWALGEWMEALSSTPEGREAWIVVVSDHNLHKNRFLRGPKNHVPFIVHRPGQTGRRDIAAPADLTDLRHVLPELPIFGEDAGAAGPEP